MRRYKSGLTLAVIGVIAFFLLSTIVWASPPAAKKAVTLLAVTPFEIEATSEIGENLYLQFLHHWLGYTEIWSIGNPEPTPQGTIYIPVHNPVILQGKPLRLLGIEVCYQVTPGSHISRTSVYYANRTGGRTQILNSETDRVSPSWTCYKVTTDAPQLVRGPLLIYFLLGFDDGDSEDRVTIGQVTLKLAN